MRYLLICLTLLAPLAASAATPAARQGLTVSPVQTTLAAGQRATSVTMSNGTTEEKVIQAEVVRWTHVNGEDHYEPATDLLVNPPLFKLPPNASQIVRVGYAKVPPPGEREMQYRLYLQEVPVQANGPAAEGGGGAQLKMLLRLGVPVFVAPASPAPEALQWHAQRKGADVELQLTNAGNTHVRAAEIALGPHGGAVEQFARASTFAYVFPGETHSWVLQPVLASTQRQLTVQVRTDKGETRVEIPLASP